MKNNDNSCGDTHTHTHTSVVLPLRTLIETEKSRFHPFSPYFITTIFRIEHLFD